MSEIQIEAAADVICEAYAEQIEWYDTYEGE